MGAYMNFIILTLILATLPSCGFHASKDDKKSSSSGVRSINDIRTDIDSDGDLSNDKIEVELGRNPYVADIPNVEVNFLQNYKIKVFFQDKAEFIINTKTARDDPDFKYRVGELFLKENSLNQASKFGRFSGISWGDIKQQDYSWIKYPDIDERFYFSKKRDYSKLNSKEIEAVEIVLENSLKLSESPIFKSIEQLELNFYYYSYSKESYVQLHTEKIENTFQTGVRDDFSIVIQNPPKELLEDTYMRHGEFIISEVKDFYIPEYEITYRELLASVKAKTIPVYRTTPFSNELKYIAIPKKGETFIEVLGKWLGDKFEVQGNQLIQIEQFANNLPSFKHLHELKDEDKSGQWFVMTNPLKQHYLKHKFTNKDSITLSYVTGSQLSNRASELIPSFRENVFSTDTDKTLPLGNISNNSEISVSIYLNRLKGVELSQRNGHFAFSPRCSGNCTGDNWSVWANFTINSFKDYQKPWEFYSFEELSPAFDLYINNTKLSLEELVADNLAKISFKETENGNYLNVQISGIHKLDAIQSGQENIAFIKIRPLKSGLAGEGLRIDQVGGKNIDEKYHAGLICLQEAAKRKIPLAVTSWAFSHWEPKVPWGQPSRRTGYKPVRGHKKKYYDGVVLDIVSKITNFYN